MRKLFAVIFFAAVLAGCGGGKDETPPASTPASAEVEAEHDLDGYSEGVRKYYGAVHDHNEIDDPNAAIEAEYHQPPQARRGRCSASRSPSPRPTSACGSR